MTGKVKSLDEAEAKASLNRAELQSVGRVDPKPGDLSMARMKSG